MKTRFRIPMQYDLFWNSDRRRLQTWLEANCIDGDWWWDNITTLVINDDHVAALIALKFDYKKIDNEKS